MYYNLFKNKKKKKGKIFGIGLNRTGTTTLGVVLQKLGYRVAPYNISIIKAYLRMDYDRIIKWVESFDAFQDWPWPFLYKTLDKEFPNSKFILTKRISVNKWYKSQINHSLKIYEQKGNSLETNKIFYNYFFPIFHEKEHKTFYLKYNNNVREYFKGREENFIELCWEEDPNWEKICSFLKVENPRIPFPHKRKSNYNNYDNNINSLKTNSYNCIKYDINEI